MPGWGHSRRPLAGQGIDTLKLRERLTAMEEACGGLDTMPLHAPSRGPLSSESRELGGLRPESWFVVGGAGLTPHSEPASAPAAGAPQVSG